MYFSGLMGCPLYQSSKCRCGPVLSVPLLPTKAMASPPFTRSPSFFSKGTTMFVNRNQILIMLYTYQIACFGGISA